MEKFDRDGPGPIRPCDLGANADTEADKSGIEAPDSCNQRLTDILRKRVNVDDLRPPRWQIPVRRALYVHGSALAGLAATAGLLQVSTGAACAMATLAAGALAIGYRGLENLVHGAAHFDLFGRKGKILGRGRASMNDCVANLLIALPVAQDVAAFRLGHLADHHGGFGRRRDPCRQRMLGHSDVQLGAMPTVKGTLLQLPRDALAFYRTIGAKPSMPARALIWHFAAYVVPLSLLVGMAPAAIAWTMVFLPLFLVTLPVVRGLAESGEHDYRPAAEGLDMVQRTYGHQGFWNRMIHPFGDDLHPEHHIWPDVPQYSLKIVKRRMRAAGLANLLLRRTTVLGVESRDH